MILRDYVSLNHVRFEEKAEDWKDAVRLGCEVLEKDGSITPDYKNEIIETVEEYGPYFIIAPGIAAPHVQRGSDAVLRNATSFLKLEEPVSFDENDPNATVSVLLTIAGQTPDHHIDYLVRISEILMDEHLREEILNAKSADDLMRLDLDVE